VPSSESEEAEFLRLLGDLYLRRGNAADAIDCYSAALRWDPDELLDPGEIERCYLDSISSIFFALFVTNSAHI